MLFSDDYCQSLSLGFLKHKHQPNLISKVKKSMPYENSVNNIETQSVQQRQFIAVCRSS
jgi:hypothetical protein